MHVNFDKNELTLKGLEKILVDSGYTDTKVVDMEVVADPESRYLAIFKVLFDDLDSEVEGNVFLWCERNGEIRADF